MIYRIILYWIVQNFCRKIEKYSIVPSAIWRYNILVCSRGSQLVKVFDLLEYLVSSLLGLPTRYFYFMSSLLDLSLLCLMLKRKLDSFSEKNALSELFKCFLSQSIQLRVSIIVS